MRDLREEYYRKNQNSGEDQVWAQSRDPLVIGNLFTRGDEGERVQHLDVLHRTVEVQLEQFFLHSELIKSQTIPEVSDKGSWENLLNT